MKIYFSGSISGGRGDVTLYARIVEALRAAGHDVIAGTVADANLPSTGETLSDDEICARDLGWIDEVAKAGGAVVAEVSTPSLGVGYEIAAARFRHAIPVIALHRPSASKRLSAMIAGDPGVRLIRYEESELEAMIEKLRKELEGSTDGGGRGANDE